MNYNIDMHIHSNHSCDGKNTIEEMCQAAIEKKLDIICFTEHVDLNPNDDGFGYYHHERYAKEIASAQETYCSNIRILKGIEFSEPHLYPHEYDAMITHGDYDFVLGSVHWLGENWVGNKAFQQQHSVERIFEMHYTETMKTIAFGGFDALAHIDFPKRYLSHTHEPVDMLKEILHELVKQDIALELNSASIRKGYSEIHPSNVLLEMYRNCGGRKVTIGSDAHNCADIAKDFDIVRNAIDTHHFSVMGYRKRQAFEVTGC